MDQRNNKLGWMFASPYLIYSLIFFFVPLLWSLFLSFTNWDLIAPTFNFVGIGNFLDALQSPAVHAAFWNTYKFMMIFVPLVTVMAIGVAVVVHGLPRFKGLFLIGFFLPYLSSGVVSALIVKGLLSYTSPVNEFLRGIGMDINWLGSPFSALFVVGLILAWKFTGYYALIITSGLESIDKEVYEAAAIDGVKDSQRFWRITLPLLYPSLYTTLILAFGVTFGIFTEVYQLTGGGPGNATNTWQMEIFKQAFSNMQVGYASAVALLASLATFASIFVIRKLLEIWGKRNGWV
ncbi:MULTISPECIES: sugar ABC transporter permease [unclassified Paenibacillus]|uniref:carbohydrate ABC transporter permease n=1 Tax=unclassified Paenibacillus TaxID=185978 RepID=UPI000953B2CB|nr:MULTISPECIES: sugar ABC transporter permease [unclassified Paenibacillus]ASS66918.1 sugar ABC transporter permease [Paenibacillus sp. RUD330]SIR52087.1 multiple sugar transport system permease protein [Paenibacillus sp. RU4X]SIR60990.1 multiple sugar transport system permease protein [Paenibacillus sp. RU4T]